MTLTDLGRTRFAYSPLAEVAESLWVLSSRQVHPVHRGWIEATRNKLHSADMTLLSAVVPARPFVASFLFAGASDRATSIEQQLSLLAEMPAEVMRKDLEDVWRGDQMPLAAQNLVAQGAAGPRCLAEALWRYWSVAIEPHWQVMRAVLDDDVAHRAGELTNHGVVGLLGDVHPEISVQGEVLQIDKKKHRGHREHHDLAGAGMLLVPSVFVWPNVIFATGSSGPPSLTYPARGTGNLWSGSEAPRTVENTLGALLGRSRAAILSQLTLPYSTTELALKLGQSPPSISQHLSVLRQSGLVISWRSRRSVLYRRTELATSLIEASGYATGNESSGGI